VIRQLKRDKFMGYFANRSPCLIRMEVCGGSQHWARQLTAVTHEVKLMPACCVKPFCGSNKSDVQDARAIWSAVQQPGAKTVAVKNEAQETYSAI
jgi:transposase